MHGDAVTHFAEAAGTRLLLVRHAHIDSTRLCGSSDAALSDEGHRQVDALVERVRDRLAPHALYASPLRRASLVATALATAWHTTWQSRPAVAEIHCGVVEGVPLDDVPRRWPETWQRNAAQIDDHFSWPGGETYAAFRARVVAGLTTIAEAHRGGLVVVITHAGVVSQALGVLRRRPAAVWDAERPMHLAGAGVWWDAGRPTALGFVNAPDWWRALRRRDG